MNSFAKQERFYIAALIAALATVLCATMLLSGFSPFQANHYNSYALQAQAWLQGRLDLGQNYKWLELAIFREKYYVSFPPFPSFVLLPFVLLFGENTPDHFLTLFCAFVSAVYAFKLAEIYLCDRNKSFFLSLFLCAGSNFLMIAIPGGVWFMAQGMAFALTLAALYYAAAEKSKARLSFFLLACAVGCRPFQAVYAVLIGMLLYRGAYAAGGFSWPVFVRRLLKDAIPAMLLGLLYAGLNVARFGNPLEFGHNYLPEFLEAPGGQFHLSYLMENIQSLFRLPEMTREGALVFPMFNGVAVWLVFPIVLSYAFYFIRECVAGKKHGALHWLIPAVVAVQVLLLCAHKTMGGFHFGHRYINDCMPAIALGLILLWRGKEGRAFWLNAPLLLWGILMNVYGMTLFFARY